MFHRHFDDYVHHSHGGPGHHGFGRGPFRGWRSRGGNAGGREGRMFDGGELRLVISALIAEKPRYGYEIIKELGERVGGDYSPSPGVVYPTLTMLEEMGYAQTEPGLAGAQALWADARGRESPRRQQRPDRRYLRPLRRRRRRPGAGFISVKRAMLNLRAALQLRLRGRDARPEQIQAIVDALDAAAKAVERA